MSLTRIQARRGTTVQWTAANPVLLSGEPGFDTTLERLKLGDGVTAWADLAWYSAPIPVLTPTSSADATGTNGDVAADASYLYVKVSGSWKRAALSSF